MNRAVLVHRDFAGDAHEVGTAYFAEARGAVTTTFHYSDAYLARTDAYAIDPALPLVSGPQPVPGLPGAFQDSAPDRWGRNLIRKRHLTLAREDNARPRTLTDVDYLLGVSDETRQGALRFTRSTDESFLAEHTNVPKTVSLPRLQVAADQVSRGDNEDDAVKQLLSAGTGSLGGARPKASVRGEDGRLLIAKFTHSSDEWSVTAWEKTALDLAAMAGVAVPERRLLAVSGRPVVVLARFDRTSRGRVGYLSAMTATGLSDGEGADYLDVAEAVESMSADFRSDRLELLRRVTLSVAINNTDDHLRNHGLLRVPSGWRLSPAFDINPHPDLGKARVTSIMGETSPHGGAAAIADLAGSIGVDTDATNDVIGHVLRAAAEWKSLARSNGVPEQELRDFREVFDHQREQLTRALQRRLTVRAPNPGAPGVAQGRNPRGTPAGGRFAPKHSATSPDLP